jgi:hypothetical protein
MWVHLSADAVLLTLVHRRRSSRLPTYALRVASRMAGKSTCARQSPPGSGYIHRGLVDWLPNAVAALPRPELYANGLMSSEVGEPLVRSATSDSG